MDKLARPSKQMESSPVPAMNENKGDSIFFGRSMVKEVNIKRLKAIDLYGGLEMVECVEEYLVFSPIILIAPKFDDFFEC